MCQIHRRKMNFVWQSQNAGMVLKNREDKSLEIRSWRPSHVMLKGSEFTLEVMEDKTSHWWVLNPDTLIKILCCYLKFFYPTSIWSVWLTRANFHNTLVLEKCRMLVSSATEAWTKEIRGVCSSFLNYSRLLSSPLSEYSGTSYITCIVIWNK